MEKKGVSAVVATVLIVLISVAGVAIVYAVILPMFSEISEFSDYDVDVGISFEGYTVCDRLTNVVFVQVKRGSDDAELASLDVIFSIKGSSLAYVIESGEVPATNEKKTYGFNLSKEGYDYCPDSVKVVPYVKEGVKIRSIRASEVILPTGDVASDFIGRFFSGGGNQGSLKCNDGTDCTSGFCEGGVCVEEVNDCPEGEVSYGEVCAIALTGCGGLDEEGRTYLLINDVTFGENWESCFIVSDDNPNIILDLGGHRVYGESDYSTGIYFNGNNLTLLNGEIEGFLKGIEAQGCNDCNFTDLYVSNFNIGISASGEDFLVKDSVFDNNNLGSRAFSFEKVVNAILEDVSILGDYSSNSGGEFIEIKDGDVEINGLQGCNGNIACSPGTLIGSGNNVLGVSGCNIDNFENDGCL